MFLLLHFMKIKLFT